MNPDCFICGPTMPANFTTQPFKAGSHFGLKPQTPREYPMTRIRLLLVEDNRLLREGLTAMLDEEPDIEVVAAFGNGKEAVLNAIQELNLRSRHGGRGAIL
jgi:hypothetical protein